MLQNNNISCKIVQNDIELSYDTSSNKIYNNTLYTKNISNVSNKYNCEICQYYTNIKTNYDKHLSSKKHTEKSIKNSIKEENNKKFVCEICYYNTCIKYNYDKHLSSKKHKEKEFENNKNFVCEICNYNTSIKRDYNNHLSSKKHINKTQINKPIQKDNQIYSSIMGQIKNMIEEQTKIIEEKTNKIAEEQTKLSQMISMYLNKTRQT